MEGQLLTHQPQHLERDRPQRTVLRDQKGGGVVVEGQWGRTRIWSICYPG